MVGPGAVGTLPPVGEGIPREPLVPAAHPLVPPVLLLLLGGEVTPAQLARQTLSQVEFVFVFPHIAGVARKPSTIRTHLSFFNILLFFTRGAVNLVI